MQLAPGSQGVLDSVEGSRMWVAWIFHSSGIYILATVITETMYLICLHITGRIFMARHIITRDLVLASGEVALISSHKCL